MLLCEWTTYNLWSMSSAVCGLCSLWRWMDLWNAKLSFKFINVTEPQQQSFLCDHQQADMVAWDTCSWIAGEPELEPETGFTRGGSSTLQWNYVKLHSLSSSCLMEFVFVYALLVPIHNPKPPPPPTRWPLHSTCMPRSNYYVKEGSFMLEKHRISISCQDDGDFLCPIAS